MGAVRIIGGVLGGRRLRAPRGQATRPTADRVKESLFNILVGLGKLGGAHVLDLFAGSGALGLEALSRGAADALFVDSGADPAQVIADNARALGVESRVRVVRGDVVATLGRLAGRDLGRFDLAFLDPPYAAGLAAAALAALPPLLAPGARVLLEHDRRTPPEVGKVGPEGGEIGPLSLQLMDRRRYGDTEVSFYAMPGQDST
jgi:16S rRNA (guanine(966)-N(2))-methyltransferase RsmD